MIITLIGQHTVRSLQVANIPPPDFNGLTVHGEVITLRGDSLKSITISRDGYSFEQMTTNANYSGDFVIKSTLESMKGYTLYVDGNAKIAGNHSCCKVERINGVADVQNLILDEPVIIDLFNGGEITKQPILQNMSYDFTRTFYNNLDLDLIDLSMITENNLTQCVFTEFAPTTTEIRFADDVDKEVQQYILSQRHKI